MSYWKYWHPIILDSETTTLFQIKGEMIGRDSSSIKTFLFENKKSPFCLSGATSSFNESSLHIMLRRGFLPQDKAFVKGFCMGSDQFTTRLDVQAFKLLSQLSGYSRDLAAFDLGYEYSRILFARGFKNLHQYPFKEHQNESIKKIEHDMGISLSELNSFREREKTLIPDSICSERLRALSAFSSEDDLNEKEDMWKVIEKTQR